MSASRSPRQIVPRPPLPEPTLSPPLPQSSIKPIPQSSSGKKTRVLCAHTRERLLSRRPFGLEQKHCLVLPRRENLGREHATAEFIASAQFQSQSHKQNHQLGAS